MKAWRTWKGDLMKLFLPICLMLSFLLTSCIIPTPSSVPSKVVIAYLPGMGYAQLVILKEQKTLEKQFPNTQIEWQSISNGYNLRDAVINGQVQIGASGIGPFMIGWDRGVNWKILSTLNVMDTWLMTNDPSIHSLKDIKPGMKIGLPSPDSTEAVVLRKGAQQELGNAHALDDNIYTVDYPTGVKELEEGKISANFTSPPYQFEEQSKGCNVILRSFDLFGLNTFNFVYTLQDFYDRYPNFAKTLYNDIVDVTYNINEYPATAAQTLSRNEGGTPSENEYEQWLQMSGVTYSFVPSHLLDYISFMHTSGQIYRMPLSLNEIEFPTIYGLGT
jgi:NitT/TauT family transport system substrate-binding protein